MQHNFTPPKRQSQEHRPKPKARKPSRTSFVDLTGKRFGRWLVLNESTAPRKSQTQWHCRCDCGKEKTAVLYGSLTRGASQSCGCLRMEGLVKPDHLVRSQRNPIYRVWNNMVRRHAARVCPAWRTSFDRFLQDMGPRPDQSRLVRLDDAVQWKESNCEWRTAKP